MLLTLFVEPSYFSYLISYTNGMIIVQNEWHIFIHPGHLEGMEEDRMPKKKTSSLNWKGRDERGRPRKRWREELQRDLQVLGARRWRELVIDRDKWRGIVRQAKAQSGL